MLHQLNIAYSFPFLSCGLSNAWVIFLLAFSHVPSQQGKQRRNSIIINLLLGAVQWNYFKRFKKYIAEKMVVTLEVCYLGDFVVYSYWSMQLTNETSGTILSYICSSVAVV